MENQYFFKTEESPEIFTFQEDSVFLGRKDSINIDFSSQFKIQPEEPNFHSFPQVPIQSLEVPQEVKDQAWMTQKAPAEMATPIDIYEETKEQSVVPDKNDISSQESPAKKSKKGKTTDFAYLLERKSFRMMRKYYKEKFEFDIEDPDYKKKLPKMSAEEINTMVSEFMQKELGQILLCLLTESDYNRIRDALKTIIFCDRHKKKEDISEGLDFVPLRNVLHKYNTRNLIEFLSDASNSFLYTHFFLKDGKKSANEQSDNDAGKLLSRMRHLMKESLNYLPSEINEIFESIYASIFE
ncbi:unnamed protein product [Moneuplotes crassus]|uniref:Uncharacterized protein n=1 Tax=Euplotes crassus TaxID=5936 RepID=A0AAD2CYK7_EUPCR|nr:unnamed protein product [Moneuplotes crassus]